MISVAYIYLLRLLAAQVCWYSRADNIVLHSSLLAAELNPLFLNTFSYSSALCCIIFWTPYTVSVSLSVILFAHFFVFFKYIIYR